MNNIVIEVNELAKCFIISNETATQEHHAVRETLSAKVRKLLAPDTSNGKNHVATKEVFWALKGVSFKIDEGSRVGIIGRNGAGKSTLLKILSRITAPTSGTVEIHGRVVSLLEVGTGFHPELSGRENIFLNGVILGMKRNDIKKKFDRIVSFAEIEKFLDMPVKKYSSGMYMRLAFAVASHMEPEILIIDEMLAVGDAQFQKKCLARMDEISKTEGRTILFVSHNIDAIRLLCDKAIFLNKGVIGDQGDVKKVVDTYVASYYERRGVFAPDTTKDIYFNSIKLSEHKAEYGQDLLIYCEIVSDRELAEYSIGMGISNSLDARVGSAMLFSNKPLLKGLNVLTIKMPLKTIVPGDYKLTMAISNREVNHIRDVVIDYPVFSIIPDEKHRYLFSKWQNSFSDTRLAADFM